MAEQKDMLQGLINSIYVEDENNQLSGPYDISVLLEGVLVKNTVSEDEDDTTPKYSRLSDVLFGKYDNDNLIPYGYNFNIGKQSLFSYLDDTKINWIKQFYGIFALQNKNEKVWDPNGESVVEYLAFMDIDFSIGDYLGSFFNVDEVRNCVLIKNEYYNMEAEDGKEACRYRLLNEDEIARYSLDALGTEISMLQQ